jgi:predicted ATPase
MLVVLDNCEHLLEGCAELAHAVLPRAPDLSFLATSREPLLVEGEQLYALPALGLPDGGGFEAIAASECVQLFVARAKLIEPHFELGHDAPALADLCRRLDGIPLAIELAAARTASLTIAEINDRLDDRFRLLVARTRSALPRHQTLRATLDWSYGLLSERERVAWRRLSIFPSGFTLEAAANVVADAAAAKAEVVDLVERLVSHSLVVVETKGGAARYRFLETTRAYGLERLHEAGERAEVAARHARTVRRQFERAPDDWWRMPEAQWVAKYTVELDSLRAALDWAFGTDGDPSLGVALAGASGPVWHALSLLQEGNGRLEAATMRSDADVPSVERGHLSLWLGITRQDQLPDQAIAAFSQARTHYARAGDRFGIADAQLREALSLVRMGRLDAAREALAEVKPEVDRSQLAKMRAFHSFTLGLTELMAGNLRDARTLYEAAAVDFRRSGSDSAVRTVLSNVADASWALGDLSAAEAGFVEFVAALSESPAGRRDSIGFALCNLAGVRTEKGDLAGALAAAREGLPLLLDSDRVWIFADHLALLAALAGRLAAAAHLAGYSNANRNRRQAAREPNEIRANTRVQALLAAHFGAVELERLLAEGATLDDQEACRVALEH